jgi:hypothetical protein
MTATYYEGCDGRYIPVEFDGAAENPRCVTVVVSKTCYGYTKGERLIIPRYYWVKRLGDNKVVPVDLEEAAP